MWYRDIKWENAIEKKKGANRLAWHRIATNLEFVKNNKKKTVSVKLGKAKCNKRCVSMVS